MIEKLLLFKADIKHLFMLNGTLGHLRHTWGLHVTHITFQRHFKLHKSKIYMIYMS